MLGMQALVSQSSQTLTLDPFGSTAEEQARTIPIGLHGDDVNVYKTSARFKMSDLMREAFLCMNFCCGAAAYQKESHVVSWKCVSRYVTSHTLEVTSIDLFQSIRFIFQSICFKP